MARGAQKQGSDVVIRQGPFPCREKEGSRGGAWERVVPTPLCSAGGSKMTTGKLRTSAGVMCLAESASDASPPTMDGSRVWRKTQSPSRKAVPVIARTWASGSDAANA